MRLLQAISLAYFSSASIALAAECPGQMFSATIEKTEPTSVGVREIPAFLAAASWSDGVKLSASQEGEEVWLDVIEFPGTTSVAAAPRIVWLIGRVINTDAKTVVFADKGKALFSIDMITLKDIGCRFVVGEDTGENPIALMREFYDSVVYYGSNRRIAPAYTGSLLGDTGSAMTANNEVFVPKWIMSAVK